MPSHQPAMTPEQRAQIIQRINDAPLDDETFARVCAEAGMSDGQLFEDASDGVLDAVYRAINAAVDAAV